MIKFILYIAIRMTFQPTPAEVPDLSLRMTFRALKRVPRPGTPKKIGGRAARADHCSQHTMPLFCSESASLCDGRSRVWSGPQSGTFGTKKKHLDRSGWPRSGPKFFWYPAMRRGFAASAHANLRLRMLKCALFMRRRKSGQYRRNRPAR